VGRAGAVGEELRRGGRLQVPAEFVETAWREMLHDRSGPCWLMRAGPNWPLRDLAADIALDAGRVITEKSGEGWLLDEEFEAGLWASALAAAAVNPVTVLALVDPLLEPSEISGDDRREQTGERRRRVHRRRLPAAILDPTPATCLRLEVQLRSWAEVLLICRNSSPHETSPFWLAYPTDLGLVLLSCRLGLIRTGPTRVTASILPMNVVQMAANQ
jgi:hypothetical protein